jgi:hypothetical protein
MIWPSSALYVQRGFQYRSTGIDNKFKHSDDLAMFIREVSEHLIDTGMDTISYLPSPTDTTKMCSVLTEYSKYSADTVELLSQLSMTLMTRSMTKLQASSSQLFGQGIPRNTPSLSQANGYLSCDLARALIKAMQSTLIGRFDDLKAKL